MTESNVQPEPVQADRPIPEARQWRVGTISMGLTLVALGIVLLMGRFNQSFTLVNLLRYWPLILIILGLEMILFNIFTAFKSRIRFRYDVLSIFLVLLLLFVSSGLVALESTGIVSFAARALQLSERYIEAEKLLYTADSSLKTLTLDIDEGTTNLRTYNGNEVKVSIVYKGYFSSQEEARQYAQAQLVRSQRVEETLLVQVYPPGRGHLPNNYVRQEVTILIPKNLDVELDQPRGRVSVCLEDLQSNWVINHQDSYQELEVLLEGISDARVRVTTADNGRISGNVAWDSEIENQAQDLFEAEKVWGEGRYTLVIQQSGGTVAINTR